uniref:Putative secreted protein n=1 Tax=Anopheles marajoara TaxID=58244 RepID=A0A2M4C963_9DIPT
MRMQCFFFVLSHCGVVCGIDYGDFAAATNHHHHHHRPRIGTRSLTRKDDSGWVPPGVGQMVVSRRRRSPVLPTSPGASCSSKYSDNDACCLMSLRE